MIEFVASLPPLLRAWEDRTRELADGVDDKKLHEIVERIRNPEKAGYPIRELQDHETAIRISESDIRRQLAVLHSPALVRTRAHRQFLTKLWKAAGLNDTEQALERQLALLAERQQRIAALLSSIDQRVRREQREQAQRAADEQRRLAGEIETKRRLSAQRTEWQLTVVGLFLGLAGFAELASWFNQLGDFRGAMWGLIEAAILLCLALIVFRQIRQVLRERARRSSGRVSRLGRRPRRRARRPAPPRRPRGLVLPGRARRRETVDDFAEGVRDGGTLASVALGADGAVLGGVVGEVFADERVPAPRVPRGPARPPRPGIGTRLMVHVAPRWYARPDVRLAARARCTTRGAGRTRGRRSARAGSASTSASAHASSACRSSSRRSGRSRPCPRLPPARVPRRPDDRG